MRQISVKISEVLYDELQEWLTYNPGHNQSAVIATALEKYIHEPQVLKPVGKVSKEELEASFQKMMHEHYDTIKKLS
jgi:metal-responsive CopG/Arc/MetJ family transcriptional regulator